MSDFEIKFLRRLRFREILFYCKVSPKSTRCFCHNVFLHKTMYNHSLQYLRQLDDSNRHRSTITSCTHFRKGFEFLFRCIVPIFSLDKPNTCKNQLIQVRLGKDTLELFALNTCLTRFLKKFDEIEKSFNYLFIQNTYNVSNTNTLKI